MERKPIEKLVDRYKELLRSKGRSWIEDLSEANVRADFIDPLFEILGWNISNPEEYDREYSIKDGGRADVALKIDGKPVIFIEAKRFGGILHISERGDADWLLEERQAILYAAKKDAKWAILTNFEKLRVFNARTGLTVLDFESVYDYTDRIGELLYLSKDAVATGRIDRLAERKERPDIDLEFLKQLDKWRVMLANDIYERNKDNDALKNENGQLDLERLKDAVQRILDRLVIARWAEDNLVLEDPNILERKYDDWKLSPSYNSIVDSLFADRALFDRFNEAHDGKIFERGHICEKVTMSDEILGTIVYQMNQMSFRKFDFDILGNTYETYLGHTLYLKDDGTLNLRPSQETRKESGIYYTPPYVVDYIVKNTLGELLKNKTPEEVEKIKVLDPACGSGSFLIKAFDYFKEYYENENERIRREKDEKIREYIKSSGNQLKLDVEALRCEELKGIERKILKNNIFGVDLDKQAAEIASVNLMLKALKPREKLPLILDENIRVGNSLISGTEEVLRKYFGDKWEDKEPFNWDEAFGDDGFDVIVGNPPYVTLALGKKQKYISKEEFAYFKDHFQESSEYKGNTYTLFMEQGLRLLKNKGKLGFIIPNTLLTNHYFRKMREHILKTCKITYIVNISDKVFKDAEIGGNVVLILELEKDVDLIDKNEIKIIDVGDIEKFSKNLCDIETIEQKLFSRVPDNKFLLEKADLLLVAKLEEDCVKLGDIATTYQGIITGNNKKFLSDKKETEKHIKIIRGKDIERYSLSFDETYVYFDKDQLWSNTNENMFLVDEKLISRQTSDRLVAAYDNEQYFSLDSTHVILPHNINAKYLLTLFNSRLLNYYYQKIVPEVGRTFAQVKTVNLKQLPIKLATLFQQKSLIELADRMLTLSKEFNKINTDFDRYLNLNPRIKDATLKEYIKDLPVNDREVLKNHCGRPTNKIEGKIKEFEIFEEGEWLVFKVGYIFKTNKGKEMLTKNVRAFRCRFEDEKLRKFLYYSIKEYITPGKLGKGNIYERILRIKVPRFGEHEEENRKVIDNLIGTYLVEVEKRERLEQEIEKTDREIDRRVYELYNLSDEEIRVVEDNE
jgi:Type I restriction-modification system methyltransferase subunit